MAIPGKVATILDQFFFLFLISTRFSSKWPCIHICVWYMCVNDRDVFLSGSLLAWCRVMIRTVEKEWVLIMPRLISNHMMIIWWNHDPSLNGIKKNRWNKSVLRLICRIQMTSKEKSIGSKISLSPGANFHKQTYYQRQTTLTDSRIKPTPGIF